ncbi:MAG: class I SAM-dependent methyltransferase [Planctomycetales bacterium]|nr:class I SAM-dependent methyltransferase [Planctomycetales bacterium]
MSVQPQYSPSVPPISPADLPDWAPLIRDSSNWRFERGQLVHRDAPPELGADGAAGGMKRWVVRWVYASHKRSRTVKRAINGLLHDFGEPRWGLNFGAGSTRFHPRILNLDVGRGPKTDIVNWGDELPFRTRSLDLVLSQEVLEHVDNPFHWVREIGRVLKPGGRFYCQMPFVIGYHPGPTDFWRFSREAYAQLLPAPDWEIEQLELALGHGSGLYRILVEFCAVTASVVHSKLYMPVKGAAAIGLSPLQCFDALTRFSAQRDRIPGGYLCIARKRSDADADSDANSDAG